MITRCFDCWVEGSSRDCDKQSCANFILNKLRNQCKDRQENKGLRFDDGKPRTDLLDPTALMATATVLAHGAAKYGERNWSKGMKWGRVIGSLLRHTYKFMSGEDIDKESGLPHIDLMAANVMFLQNYYRFHKDLDDRDKVVQDSNNEPTNRMLKES